MHLHHHEVYDMGTGELDYRSYGDSLLTDSEWSNNYSLYYDTDTLFMDQDTTRLAIAPRKVRQGTKVNLKLFSVGVGSFPVGREMLMEERKGIVRLNYEGGWSGNTSDNSKYQLELLEYHPGN